MHFTPAFGCQGQVGLCEFEISPDDIMRLCLKDIYVLCIWMFCCEYVHHTYAIPMKGGGGCCIFSNRSYRWFWALCRCWELDLCPLKGQQVLLTAELLLQFPSQMFYVFCYLLCVCGAGVGLGHSTTVQQLLHLLFIWEKLLGIDLTRQMVCTILRPLNTYC